MRGRALPLNQLLAYFLQGLHLAGGEGDSDFVDFLVKNEESKRGIHV